MIPPGSTLGILGGGQLGRMFTIRAREMGYDVVVLEPDPSSPAGAIATRHLVAPYDDPDALAELASVADAVTTEFENVPASALRWLADHCPCRPSGAAVAVAQDRISEKTFFRSHGLETAPFAVVAREEDIPKAWDAIGAPALLKTSRLGYDGKGQAMVESAEHVAAAFKKFGDRECVLERRLDLDAEISVVLARNDAGDVVCCPVGENVHRSGILFTTTVPALLAPPITDAAIQVAVSVAHALEYVGVLGVEMFVSDGRIFVNEMAPRPHNSGHYSIDACSVDQFELQVRTLTNLPLNQPRLLSPVCMVNLLGDIWQGGEPRWDRALEYPGVKLHLYGKREPRIGRKMGHLNCLAHSPQEAHHLALRAYQALKPE